MANKTNDRARLAILASGTGSNACALIRRAKKLSSHCEVVACISDNVGAAVLSKAESLGVRSFCFPVQRDRRQQENKLANFFEEFGVDWIFLAGYMRILSSHFLQRFPAEKGIPSKFINIHPSLLPRHPGLKAYERSYKDCYPDAGVTIHFVDQGVDTGPIILQKSFSKKDFESFEDFKARGVAIEHEIYPFVLEEIVMRKGQWNR